MVPAPDFARAWLSFILQMDEARDFSRIGTQIPLPAREGSF